ncbi:MAG: DUF4260 domain-containing protein [Asticcacaulis sp.]|nr:DUF4260 domain-containing protein [Asticcacaulis sp.]
MSGTVTGAPQTLLRLEGLFVLIAACAVYAKMGGNWWLFAALFLVPDLFMLGYLAGRKAGAALYNLGHWYALPLGAIAWGVWGNNPLALDIGLIWGAHIGFDRALGYGLKYADGFGSSHLGMKGKAAKAANCRTVEAV